VNRRRPGSHEKFVAEDFDFRAKTRPAQRKPAALSAVCATDRVSARHSGSYVQKYFPGGQGPRSEMVHNLIARCAMISDAAMGWDRTPERSHKETRGFRVKIG